MAELYKEKKKKMAIIELLSLLYRSFYIDTDTELSADRIL